MTYKIDGQPHLTQSIIKYISYLLTHLKDVCLRSEVDPRRKKCEMMHVCTRATISTCLGKRTEMLSRRGHDYVQNERVTN